MNGEEPEVLDTLILYQNGPFKIIRRYLRGIHPTRGQITWGLTGWETIEEKAVCKPFIKFEVK